MRRLANRPEIRYAESVLAGEVLACKWVQLACQRHLDDLQKGGRRGLRFDPERADDAIEFFSLLKHSKGEWGGRTFVLEPWQAFQVAVVFGWTIKATELRRFRTWYCEIPRKNGKSTMAAGIGLYLLAADGEPGAEVYSAATKRDQAKITWQEARRMVMASPELRADVEPLAHNLHIPDTASKFEPLGADPDSMDGLNVHGAIIDELHAHKHRGIWDVLETATGSRREPLIMATTTAGFDRNSICYEQHKYTKEILEGGREDDAFFGFIACLDEGDDYSDESVWVKANPNLDVSCKRDDLRKKVRKAQASPAQENGVLRLHFNQWTEQDERLISMRDWRACAEPVDEQALVGRRCFAGLDLASKIDLNAFVLYFPPEDDEPAQVLPYFWMPSDNVAERVTRDRVHYDKWVRDGWIRTTEGNVTDYRVIRRDILALARRYEIQTLGFDPWSAQQLCNELTDEGLPMVEIGQSPRHLSDPTEELLKQLLGREIVVGENPVLTWNAGNVAARQDADGHVKPDKKRSKEKIDGIVALVIAMKVYLASRGPTQSRWEDPEAEVVLI